ncbi:MULTISPECIES: TreTu family toxin [unclassified Photobacterium]|uniref:TreTu family toxin n=1 Tax=unclassified Photobacterium TaxID=2628852 RepID=UPI003FA72FB1
MGAASRIAKGAGTETVQRWMSRAELKATQETGLLRGGRDGTHYVTDSANSDALRARQRSALPQTPEVRVTLEVPKGVFSKPSKVAPAFNMPGGGMERTATGKIPVTIKRVQ